MPSASWAALFACPEATPKSGLLSSVVSCVLCNLQAHPEFKTAGDFKSVLSRDDYEKSLKELEEVRLSAQFKPGLHNSRSHMVLPGQIALS
jgi:hypothetical protein